MNLKRESDESFTQVKTKLELSYKNYLESRQVDKFQDHVDLIIADRLKELLPDDLRRYLFTLEVGDKWFHPTELVDLLDKYSNNKAASFNHNDSKRIHFRQHNQENRHPNHNSNWGVNKVNISTANLSTALEGRHTNSQQVSNDNTVNIPRGNYRRNKSKFNYNNRRFHSSNGNGGRGYNNNNNYHSYSGNG